MKSLFLSIALLGLLATGGRAANLHALYPDSISISGVIRQEAPNSKTGTLQTPVTIANILAALNIQGQNPKNLRYYYDQDIDGFVIAPKGIAAGGMAAPTAVVFTFGPTTTAWNGKAGKPVLYVHGGNGATGFDSGLQGGRQDEAYKLGKSGTRVATTAILVGTTNAASTIVAMGIIWSF